jgi:hypothetical protein
MCVECKANHDAHLRYIHYGPPAPPPIPAIPNTIAFLEDLAYIYSGNTLNRQYTTPELQKAYKDGMVLVKTHRAELTPHLERLIWTTDNESIFTSEHARENGRRCEFYTKIVQHEYPTLNKQTRWDRIKIWFG